MVNTLAALAITMSLGHINAHGDVPKSDRFKQHGTRIALSLPPRTQLSVEDDCHYIIDPVVRLENGRRLRERWTEDSTIQRYRFVRFDGVEFDNLSRTQWANVYGRVVKFDNC